MIGRWGFAAQHPSGQRAVGGVSAAHTPAGRRPPRRPGPLFGAGWAPGWGADGVLRRNTPRLGRRWRRRNEADSRAERPWPEGVLRKHPRPSVARRTARGRPGGRSAGVLRPATPRPGVGQPGHSAGGLAGVFAARPPLGRRPEVCAAQHPRLGRRPEGCSREHPRVYAPGWVV